MSSRALRAVSPESRSTDWQEIEVVVPRRLPRIPPGEYQAVTVRGTRYEAFGRLVLELAFDVYGGDITAGQVLARLPMYLRWSKSPSARSKLGRLLHVAGLELRRGQKVSLACLAQKAFRVRVVDAEKDEAGHALATNATYSRIEDVLERLA